MFSPNIYSFQYMVRYYPNLWDCRPPSVPSEVVEARSSFVLTEVGILREYT